MTKARKMASALSVRAGESAGISVDTGRNGGPGEVTGTDNSGLE